MTVQNPRIVKVTKNGVVLSTGAGARKITINNKETTTYEGGKLGFAIVRDAQSCGIVAGESFPYPATFSSESVIDQTTKQPMNLVWCKIEA